jgi:hypothetical protein
MPEQSFKFKKGNINHFISFAEGDPYYLDFSEGGQKGTISWKTMTAPWENIEDGFKVTYKAPDQDALIAQIRTAVTAFNKE